MPKKLFQRLLPDPKVIRNLRYPKFLGRLIHDPHLWHLNRRSVPLAFSVGLFVAFVPVPGQMVLAAALAVLLHANLPISVALVWITNPITMPPMYFFAYKIGAWILGERPKQVYFERSVEWLFNELTHIWEPFLLGCLVLGVFSAIAGYVSIRSYWRYEVRRVWRARRRARERASQS